MEYDFLVYWCALNRIFSFRCRDGQRLVRECGGADAVFHTNASGLHELMPSGDDIIDEILNPRTLELSDREVAWALERGIKIIPADSEAYPSRLRECPDAPLVLYYRGNADLNASRVLAVVGTRKATYTGRSSCHGILEHLARLSPKPLIVSGLALGIDGCAHRASIEYGLPTVGVLPTGMDDMYPRSHCDLAREMLDNGAIITDFPKSTPPMRHTFLRRNRIVAGMADATLLVESYIPGGGLITASLASSYGREVFAVPGRISDASFAGCNKLISDNVAAIVDSPETLSRSMRWEGVGACAGKERILFRDVSSEAGKAIIKVIAECSPVTTEEIMNRTGLGPSVVSAELLELEIDGRICSENHFYYLCR